MKSYTDLPQSRILAEILSHDIADQTYERFVIAGDNLGGRVQSCGGDGG